MVLRSIRLPRARANQFAFVKDLSLTKLAEAAGAVEALGDIIDMSLVEAALARILGDQAASELAAVLLGLGTMLRREPQPAGDFVREIADGLPEAGWSADQVAEWRTRGDLLTRLLSSPAVILSVKAANLSYDYSAILTDARIIVDLRPVFNDNRTDLAGASITHTFRIDYATPEGTAHSLSLSVDVKDIERLRDTCVSALNRSQVLGKKAVEWHISTIIPGQENE